MAIDTIRENGKVQLLFNDDASLTSFLRVLKLRLGAKADDIWCGISLKRPVLFFLPNEFEKHIQPLM